MSRLWKASLVVLAGATTADAVSSWNRPESNPLLRGGDGRFSARGIALKAGLAGCLAATQFLLTRGGGERPQKIAAYMNFSAAGVYGIAAVHNYRQTRTPVPAYLSR